MTLSGATLWFLYGTPGHQQTSDAGAPGSRPNAATRQPAGPGAPHRAVEASPHGSPGGIEARGGNRPAAEAIIPPAAASTNAAGSSSTGATEPQAPTPAPAAQTQTEAGAGGDQPQPVQDRRVAAGQQAIVKRLTGSPPATRCNVDLCAATYASFHATDCTYQPYGGGPRQLCERGASSAAAPSQKERAAEETRAAGKPEEAAKSGTSTQAAAQCDVAFCSGKYASFHAADCTYQPYGGGPRRLCER